MINKIFEDIDEKNQKRFIIEFIFGILFSVVIYSTFMTQQLTNTYDGMWRQTYFISGNWEASLGRWLLPIIDTLHFGLHLDPMTSLMTLSTFVIGFILILDLFEVKNLFIALVSMSVFLSSTLVSIILSYRFTSFSYGLAFLFAVMAVYVPVKMNSFTIKILLSALLICFFMALYQAFLAVYGLLILFYIIFLILKGDNDFKKILSFIILTLECSIPGIIIYAFSLAVSLKNRHIALSSYHGADSSGTTETLANLPKSMLNAYSLFFNYFFNPDKFNFRLNALQDLKILWLMPVIFLFILIITGIHVFKENKKDRRMFIIYCIIVLLLPIACNAALVIAPNADFSLQTTVGPAIFFSLSILLLDNESIKIKKPVSVIIGCISMILLYGSILQLQIDQNAMLEGRKASEVMALDILDDLKDQGFYGSTLFFVGNPADNELFIVSPNYYRANPYAKIGSFALVRDCMRLSYQSFYYNYLHTPLNVSDKMYEDLAYSDEVKSMPSYPNAGYIQPVDDVVVVKLNK